MSGQLHMHGRMHHSARQCRLGGSTLLLLLNVTVC